MDGTQSPLSSGEQAAGWHRRLNEERVSEETQREFDDWLNSGPEHSTLYDAIDLGWTALKSASDDPRILALRHETALRLTRRKSRAGRPLRWAIAACVLAIGAGALAAWTLDASVMTSMVAAMSEVLHLGSPSTYKTATGERLALILKDGSQVSLDTQSELQVDFSASERTVRLRYGQAFFDVAKDKGRPFVVQAGAHRLTALGTAFDVRLDRGQMNVTMLEGVVRVEQNNSPATAHPATNIAAGDQLVADSVREVRVRKANPERLTSWRNGRLIFDNTRLADAVAEMNRYSEVKIQLKDATLKELRLSGGFDTGRQDVFVDAVTNYFPARVSQTDERTITLVAQ